MNSLRSRSRYSVLGGVLSLLFCFQLLSCSVAQTNRATDEAVSAAVSIEGLAAQISQHDAPLVLDVRSAQEYAAGHIPGAVNIDYRQISEQLARLRPYQHRDVIVYCERGVRAGRAETTLIEAGFSAVSHLSGDFAAWREANLPVENGKTLP